MLPGEPNPDAANANSPQAQPSDAGTIAAPSGPPSGYLTDPIPGERFPPGTLLTNRYRIVSALGKGGMGEVYRADDLTLAQPVALKFLPPFLGSDPARLDGLRKEVAAARRVSHPNVCRVYDISDHEGQPFLTMEFVDGEDLASLLKRVGRLSEEKALEVSRQLCASLAAVHDQGLLHRDLKPANVMLDGRGRVRLTDFGLAAAEKSVSQTEVRFGTPTYQAPEQAAGKEVTVRSDVFALGLIMYELFTGKRAYNDASRESPPTTPSSHIAGINHATERTINRCLALNPDERPQSAAAVLADLPGGDPLAEAVAAGVTPSPQVVAAAGIKGTLSIRVAGALMTGVVVCLAIFLALYDKVMLVGMVGLPEPTDALGRRARDVFQMAGLDDRADAIGFDHDQQFLYFETDPHDRTTWAEWCRRRPVTPIYFWCRQTPTPFSPDLFYPYAGSLEPPRVSWTDPGPIVPGMAAVKVDVKGRLLTFFCLPPDFDREARAMQPPVPEIIWRLWFHHAGYDFLRFTQVQPDWVPPVYADTRYAWIGTTTDPNDLQIRIEAATYRGHIVSFEVISPWTRRDIGDPTQGVADQGAAVSQFELFVPLLVAIFVLGPLHLRRGQADAQGGFRLGVLVFAIQMVVWACENRHQVDGYAEFRLEIRALVLGLAFALYWAALIAGAYLALEPLVRRWWPEAAISWTRLLAGRWQDPLVGRDLLVGVLGGLVWIVVSMIGNLLPHWLGEPAASPWWDWWVPNTRVPGYWTGTLLITIVYAFRTAFFYNLLLLVLLRQLFRRPIVYAAAFVLVWTMLKAHDVQLFTRSPGGWLSVVLGLAFLAIGNLIMFGMLVRFGVLAVIAGAFVVNCLWFPMTLDLNSGLTHSGLLIIAIVIGLAGCGFYTATRNSQEKSL
ncbi:MAG: serine/threonine protein kinase [Planctomycetes bacterium]|nr:serine/threonine protein kinase [Planctomycetota bacterium]